MKEKNPEDSNVENLAINMNFLGLDLNKIPQQNLGDWTVYIIPVLYILSTFLSMKMTASIQEKKKDIVDVTGDSKKGKDEDSKALVEKEEEEYDPMAQTNKMMSWMMPIMSVSISLVAPLGLALYWLVNNIVMMLERIILNKVMKDD